jgi:hypothetical protein
MSTNGTASGVVTDRNSRLSQQYLVLLRLSGESTHRVVESSK